MFRFELTWILRFELTIMELILDLDSMTLTILYRTVCELLYEHLICVCLCNKQIMYHGKLLLIL